MMVAVGSVMWDGNTECVLMHTPRSLEKAEKAAWEAENKAKEEEEARRARKRKRQEEAYQRQQQQYDACTVHE